MKKKTEPQRPVGKTRNSNRDELIGPKAEERTEQGKK